jgi:hypothetical protein
MLDTLRLYLALPLRDLPSAGDAQRGAAYLDALRDLWSQPPASDDSQALAVGLIAAAVQQRREAALVLQALVTSWRIPLTAAMAEALARILLTTPGLADDPRLDEDWWERVERVRPDIRSPGARLRAAVLDLDADPVTIAVLMGRAASGISPEKLYQTTRDWLHARPRAEVELMLRIVDGVVRLSRGERQVASPNSYMSALSELLDLPPADRLSQARWRRRPPQ